MSTVLKAPVQAGSGMSWLRGRVTRGADEWLSVGIAALLVGALVVFLAWPLSSILGKSVLDAQGSFTGFGLIVEAWGDVHLREATMNSLGLAACTTALVLPLALLAGFALQRSRLPGRYGLRLLLLAPLLTPSLMPAISLVYLFGNQGLLRGWLGSHSIYGPLGIVLGEIYNTFPHALLVVATALAGADARLYEAAASLGASKWRRFWTVTVPQARYGLVSAGMVVFTIVVTDLGVPKVLGGQTQMLAVEAYKQVIGQQNFSRGAVVGLMLMIPALLSVAVQRWLSRRQTAGLSGRSQMFKAPRNRGRDVVLGLCCGLMALFIVALIGVAITAGLMKMWPYQLSFTLEHFQFDDVDGGGWQAFYNSLRLALTTALVGTIAVFLSAYLGAKQRLPAPLPALLRGLSMLPMAVPGLVLGLGYIFAFNNPSHPLRALYGTMTLMVACTVVHFFTTAHLTLSTALRQIDPEIEAASRSLGRPWWSSARRVTLPLCAPALLDAARYFFVSSLTTVSAVIFLYTPDSVLASVSVLAMDDAGDTAAAAAMASLVVLSALLGSLLLQCLAYLLMRRHRSWRPL